MIKYSEEETARIRENALELYELLQEFLAKYQRAHIVIDREFIGKVSRVLLKCKAGGK